MSNLSNQSQDGTGEGGALAGVLGVGAIFMVALVYGYSAAFAQKVSGWAAILLGLAVWVVAMGLALAAAQHSIQRSWVSLPLFVLLFVISALGAVNSLMYVFDGDDIVLNP